MRKAGLWNLTLTGRLEAKENAFGKAIVKFEQTAKQRPHR